MTAELALRAMHTSREVDFWAQRHPLQSSLEVAGLVLSPFAVLDCVRWPLPGVRERLIVVHQPPSLSVRHSFFPNGSPSCSALEVSRRSPRVLEVFSGPLPASLGRRAVGPWMDPPGGHCQGQRSLIRRLRRVVLVGARGAAVDLLLSWLLGEWGVRGVLAGRVLAASGGRASLYLAGVLDAGPLHPRQCLD